MVKPRPSEIAFLMLFFFSIYVMLTKSFGLGLVLLVLDIGILAYVFLHELSHYLTARFLRAKARFLRVGLFTVYVDIDLPFEDRRTSLIALAPIIPTVYVPLLLYVVCNIILPGAVDLTLFITMLVAFTLSMLMDFLLAFVPWSRTARKIYIRLLKYLANVRYVVVNNKGKILAFGRTLEEAREEMEKRRKQGAVKIIGIDEVKL